jgi:hypothetical protein
MHHEEAAALIAQFGSTSRLVRHIVREMVANPDAESDLRLVAAACHEILSAGPLAAITGLSRPPERSRMKACHYQSP